MKSIIYLILLIHIFCIDLVGQPKYFEKSIGWVTAHSGQKVDVINDSTYIIVGNQIDLDDLQWTSHSLISNQYGEIIQQNHYILHKEIYSFDIDKNIHGYGFVGCSQITEEICVYSIILTDFEGREQSIKLLADTTVNTLERKFFNILAAGLRHCL